jgi:arylsulfatase A-like enzyme
MPGCASVRVVGFALVAAGAAACSRPTGPQPLLTMKTEAGSLPRSASLMLAGAARPALLERAAWRIGLPERPLLTLGAGAMWAGSEEAPGWFQLSVRLDGRQVAERRLNPRALRGWRDVSIPLEGTGRRGRLEIELRLTDRDGRDIPRPPGLVLAAADPVVHDLDAYGRARGIVLVSIDTLRRDHVGAYGYARPTTPRLDALAAQGLVLEDAVSASSWTLPAHLSMLTGVDPGVHGGVDMDHGFNRRLPILPELLRGAGYATQAVTSHLYVSGVYGLDQGFEHLDFHQDRKANDVADRALGLLDRFGDRPFFLFLHFYDPHWHYDPPPETLRLFESSYAGTLSGRWQDFSKRTRESLAPADVAHLLALYDGEIRFTDDHLGRILDHLRDRGLEKSTLVMVTSDHGEEFLEHRSWEHQKTLYEEVVRVPLLLRGPGVPVRREPAQATVADVAPTILHWAGLPIPVSMQGRSLLRAAAERDAYGETDHTADGTRKLFLRGGQGRWKAVLSLARDTGAVAREEWYDLGYDPGETVNSPPPEAQADALRQRALGRWRQGRAGAAGPAVALTPEQRERLRALGYVGN